jgi:hypothetical protein
MGASKLGVAFVCLLPALAAAGVLYLYNSWEFSQGILSGFARQDGLSFPYYVKPGLEANFTLLLGDLNGLNKGAYERLLSMAGKPAGTRHSAILVPSIMPEKSSMLPAQITPEDFYAQISNDRGVVLADNFCTAGWEKAKDKALYASTALTPGPFCSSEPETRDLNSLIKAYRVSRVEIAYDAENYRDFIQNFIDYLEENGISYEFVQSRDVPEAFK